MNRDSILNFNPQLNDIDFRPGLRNREGAKSVQDTKIRMIDSIGCGLNNDQQNLDNRYE